MADLHLIEKIVPSIKLSLQPPPPELLEDTFIENG